MVRDIGNQGRRQFLKGVGASVGVVGVAGCLGDDEAEAYPSESIRSIVPYASGGGFDEYSRLAAPYFEEYLDTEVTVENVTGGGGITGITQVYNEEPDGYTITIWDVYQAVTNQIGRDVAYDMFEMSHIGALTQSPNAMVVMEEAGIDDWDDFLSRIDEFDFVTQGVGSGAHTMSVLLGELTGEFSGEDLNFVHYGGTGEALAGLERGEGQVFTVATATSAAAVVRALEDAEMFVVFSDPDGIEWYLEDMDALPMHYSSNLDTNEIDTYAELTVFRRFFTGPPGVPEEILGIQRDAFEQVIEDDDFLGDAAGAGRPIINPGDYQQVENSLDVARETFGEEPYRSIFDELLDD